MKTRLLIYLFLLLSLRGYSQTCTLSVNLTQSDPAICSGNSVKLTAAASSGTPPYIYNWSTGETTSSISVNKAGTYTVSVSDKTAGCQPVTKSITVTAASTPNAPSAKAVIVCPNSPATLTATAPGGTYQWYDSNGTFLFTGDTYTTGNITAPTIFYVQTTLSGCTSPQTAVSVTFPAKPTITAATVCAGNVATLMAAGGDTYAWYDAATNGNLVGTDANFTTPVLTATKTYYVVVTTNGCVGARTPVTATVTSAPAAPTASDPIICSGSTANLHANGSGFIDWFTDPTGGTSLITSPDYTTPSLTATTIYYVQSTVNDCVSQRVPVTVTVNSPPPAPDPQTVTICYNSSAALTASATPTGTYKWYDAPSGGNLLFTGVTYNTPVLTGSTSYYVQAVDPPCSSGFTQINVTVSPLLSAPTSPNVIICSGTSTVLTATSSGGTYQWYSAATNGTFLADGTYTTPVLTANATYYVQRTLNGCISPRTAVKVTVLAPPAPPTASNSSTCSGSVAVLTASSPSNTFAWYDAATNGNLLSTGQVFVTPALTTTTVYYVETSNAAGCASTRKAVTVTVNPIPPAPTASGTTICPNTSASLTASGSGTIQWYNSASGGTILFTGATYNTPALKVSTTYYVQSTVATCSSSRTAVTVVVNTGPNPQFQYSSGTYCASGSNTTPTINNPAGGTFSASPAGLVFVSTTTGEINMAASTPGQYVVSFTSNGGCTVVSTARVAIVTTTNANFSYSPSYCQTSANVAPTFPAGASAGTFSATPAGLTFINTSTGDIDIAKSIPNTYTITNTIAASGTCPASAATFQVTIYQPVVVDAGPNQSVLSGSNVQLAGNISGGITTGKWTGGTGSFSNPTSPTATYTPGAGETSAKLTLTSDNPAGPCGPALASVTITFNSVPPAPTALGKTICAGSTATLSATAPGGGYRWWDSPTGGTQVGSGPSFTTPVLTVTTNYYVETTVNGVTSNRTMVTVTVNTIPTAPVAAGTQTCSGTTATLTAGGGTTGTYQWYDAAVGGNLLSNNDSYTTPVLTANTSYYVQSTVNSCSSTRTQVDVTILPAPVITSNGSDRTCSGNALNYTITADLAGTTFTWGRAAVAGISNGATNNQTSSTITEALINTTTSAVNVTYVIVPVNGTCTGASFNCVVTVYPEPVVTSDPTTTICNQTATNYAVAFNTPGTSFSWSRAAVTGISNNPVSGQTSPIIKEVLFNTTDAAIDVTYTFNYKTTTCSGTPFNFVVTVNPGSSITSAPTGIACSGVPQNYQITSNIPGTTYSWSRAAVANISNPTVTNQTSSVIDEALVNTGSNPVGVVYTIVPSINGCTGATFKYSVGVNPVFAQPAAFSNTPVCVGNTITLSTPTVANATYQWTGPNGFSVTDQNPEIDNATTANTGDYTLIETIKGCSTPPKIVSVMVDEPAVVTAGPDQNVCSTVKSVFLAGNVSGGTTTGIWKPSGTGNFSPDESYTDAKEYIPSQADIDAGSVVLTLTSTSKDDCPQVSSSMTVKFGLLQGVDAGPDQSVCSQDALVPLNGKQFTTGTVTWSSPTGGNFTPSPNQLNAGYAPTATDIKNGSVKLVLSIVAGPCYTATDTVLVNFIPPPTLNAGGIRYVLKGRTITLNPVVSTNDVTYLWSPNIDISNVTVKNPVVTGDIDRGYQLTVTDSRGCTTQDSTFIKVSPPIVVDNTFTPNGDGINDQWVITGLIAYENATVDIFTRNGINIFHSIGYPKNWDGTYNGKALPAGVYYYVIDTKAYGQIVSGSVTIIR